MDTLNNNELRTITIKRNNRDEPRIESTELLAQDNTLTIVHQKQDYLLRVTKAGKLILTK